MNCLYGDTVCRYNQKCHSGFMEKIIGDTNVVQKCSIYENIQNKKMLAYNLSKAGIHNYISNMNFCDYKGKDSNGNIDVIKKYVSEFTVDSPSLYFYGGNGTQKSTVARIIGKDLLSKGLSVKYIITDDLVKDLVRADRDDELRSELDKLLTIDFLIVDEFERSKMVYYESGWQLKFIFPFFKKRFELIRKPVLVISNSHLSTVGKNFDTSTQDLFSREIHSILTFEDNYILESTKADLNSLRG